MEIKKVADVLANAGFGNPTLNALVPNEETYSVLLLQPKGDIEVDDHGVRNKDRNLAGKQFGAFLDEAHETAADLVITPEYSMPWETLSDAIRNGSAPENGKLWVLGCESIKVEDLENIRETLSGFATVDEKINSPLTCNGPRQAHGDLWINMIKIAEQKRSD